VNSHGRTLPAGRLQNPAQGAIVGAVMAARNMRIYTMKRPKLASVLEAGPRGGGRPGARREVPLLESVAAVTTRGRRRAE
jgi:hypothetical protein